MHVADPQPTTWAPSAARNNPEAPAAVAPTQKKRVITIKLTKSNSTRLKSSFSVLYPAQRKQLES